MSDLRKAAQQALEALEEVDGPITALLGSLLGSPAEDAPGTKVRTSITALRAALAQQHEPVQEPVQEPVAKVELMTTGGNAGLATRIVEIEDHLRERLRPGQLLYTTPPQRPPLTDEEIAEVYREWDVGPWANIAEFARAIERKVRGEAE